MSTGVNNSKEDVLCSFCSEKSSPSQIGEHLMICGNKTDQCPNCRKYIRRAIFAYHYENNCANLDEIDTDFPTNANPPNSATRPQPADPPPPSTPSITGDNNQRKIWSEDLRPHSNQQPSASHRSESDFCESNHITIVCPYCGYDCEISQGDTHVRNCLRNPKNIAQTQQLQDNLNSGRLPDRSVHINEQNDTADIPCEYCNRPIKWNYYQEHLNVCNREYNRRIQEQSQVTYRGDDPATGRCRYCGKQYMTQYLGQHEGRCKQNPTMIDLERQHRSIFCLPFPRNISFF